MLLFRGGGKGAKVEFNVQFGVQLAVFIVGLLVALAGFLKLNDKVGLPLVILGAQLAVANYVTFVVINSLKHRAKTSIYYTSTGEENWAKAINMAKKMDSHTRAYDVSSRQNKAEFEQILLEKVKAGVHLTRVFAFDVTARRDKKTKYWVEKMLDPAKDKSGKYKAFREAIIDGRLRILHLPHSIYADFFILEKEGRDEGYCVFGFPKDITDATYQSGIYSEDAALSRDFKVFFTGTILKLAEQHLRDVKDGVCKCELCQNFDAPSDWTTLLPKSEPGEPDEV